MPDALQLGEHGCRTGVALGQIQLNAASCSIWKAARQLHGTALLAQAPSLAVLPLDQRAKVTDPNGDGRSWSQKCRPVVDWVLLAQNFAHFCSKRLDNARAALRLHGQKACAGLGLMDGRCRFRTSDILLVRQVAIPAAAGHLDHRCESVRTIMRRIVLITVAWGTPRPTRRAVQPLPKDGEVANTWLAGV